MRILMKSGFIISLLVVFSVTKLHAQFYNSGTVPTRTKWNQIKTDEFTLIFPRETGHFAQSFANALSNTTAANKSNFGSINVKPLKIIIQNYNVVSNGYVTLAPKRMEIIASSPQDNHSESWEQHLALHEYRHVIQTSALDRGFTHGLKYFLGEMGVGATAGYLPLWFLEGDAVFTETLLSKTGRGREPGFMKEIKALELENSKRPSYEQAYLGSYKFFTPDYYRYGYQMVAYAKTTYGNQIFDKSFRNINNKPFSLAPFYFGLKKSADLSKVKLYNESLNFLSDKWLNEYTETYNYRDIQTHFQSDYVNYKFPFSINNRFFAIRSSFDDVTRLVEITNDKEISLFEIGYFYGSQIGVGQNLIAWEEVQNDIRWEQQNYSVIRVYDLAKNSSCVLKRKSKHFSPSIDKTDKLIALINYNSSQESSIDIYSIANKKLIVSFNHPENQQLMHNCWIDSINMAVLSLDEKGKTINKLNTKTGEWTLIFGPSVKNISHLNSDGNKLYFTYTLDGSENIYSIDLKTNETVRITQNNIGVDFAFTYENKLIFSEYSFKGYKPKTVFLDSVQKTNIQDINSYQYAFLSSETIVEEAFQPKTRNFEVEKYQKWKHLINIHSWIVPFYFDLTETGFDSIPVEIYNNLNPGFNLLSQNVLSTLTTSVGYYYKDGYHHVKPVLKYQGIYPIITLDMDLGGETRILVRDSLNFIPDGISNQKQINLSISQPLRFSTSRFSAGIEPEVRINFENLLISTHSREAGFEPSFTQNQVDFYKNSLLFDGNISAYAFTKQSSKDLYPRWGFNAYASQIFPVKNNPYFDNFENRLAIVGIYLPGLYRHHSLRIRASLEEGLYNRIILPRGYSRVGRNRFLNDQKVSIDYAFPLLYPDISCGPIAYLKRIHANTFFDYMQYKIYNDGGEIYRAYINSTGLELGFETHFLRFFWPVTPTIRYSYLIDESDYDVSFFMTSSYNFSL
ncbi:MAG: hypothetical protein JXA77_09345 [Bacteroidales bacterium]|nr:hypothetical protein [Bacteroidales bacterium]MBN2817373.1 hypothetical protein [Bacteroidales bacterium]